jgi:hypothetical protein
MEKATNINLLTGGAEAYVDGTGKVYADIPEFSSKVKQALAEKQLRYVSVEIYEFDKRDAAEAPYLSEVTLLGRDPPVVPGTKLPTLFELLKGDGLSTNKETSIAAFTRKVTGQDCRFIKVEREGTMNKEGSCMDEEKLKAELATKEAEAAAFKKEWEELKSTGKQHEAQAYFGKLRDDGKLPPALFEKVVALDIRLEEAERKELRALVGEFETKVDLSCTHIVDKKKKKGWGWVGIPGSDTLTAKIRAFQKEKCFASFEGVINALYTVQPSLFEEGGRGIIRPYSTESIIKPGTGVA